MKNVFWGAVGAVLTAWSSLTFAAGEVKLIDVTSIVSIEPRENAPHQQIITFEAAVRNLAPHKQVFAHYKGADGKWVDAPLSFLRAGDGDTEVWQGTVRPAAQTTFDVQFALRYVVKGETYWDNNNGQNYFIAKDSGIQLASGVNVVNYVPMERFDPVSEIDTMKGIIALRNLGSAKNVSVRYTTDNWATTRTARAEFHPMYWLTFGSSAGNPNEYGVETWIYFLDAPKAKEIEYAIQYEVNGQTFWDNNFGRNFRAKVR